MLTSRILTREEFARTIDAHFDVVKQDILEWVKLLDKDTYKREALRRFDMGAEKYGDCDLTGRDWPENADEEGYDMFTYWHFEVERMLRDLDAPPPNLYAESA